MSKFLKLKNIVNKGLLLFLFIFSINGLDASIRKKLEKRKRPKQELCGMRIPFTEKSLETILREDIELIKNNDFESYDVNTIIDDAFEAIQSEEYKEIKLGLELFEALFNKGLAFDKSLEYIENLERPYGMGAFEFFKILLLKIISKVSSYERLGYFEYAFKIINKSKKFDDSSIRNLSDGLLQTSILMMQVELRDKYSGRSSSSTLPYKYYDLMLNFLDIGIKSSSACPDIVRLSVDLFGYSCLTLKNLVIRGETLYYEKVLEFVEYGIQNEYIWYSNYAVDLVFELVKKGQIFERALEIAKQCFLIKKHTFKAADIFEELFIKDYKPAFEMALDIVKKEKDNNDPVFKMSVINLLTSLIDRAYKPAFSLALEVAERDLQNVNFGDKDGAILLFIGLVMQKEAFKRSLEVVKQEIQSGGNLGIMDLLTELVTQGYTPAFEVALQVANVQVNIYEIDDFMQEKSLRMFIALVKRGYIEAIWPAYKAFKKYILNNAEYLNFRSSDSVILLFIELLFFAVSNSDYDIKLENKLFKIFEKGISVGQGDDIEIINIKNLALEGICNLDEEELSQNMAALKYIISFDTENLDESEKSIIEEFIINIKNKLPLLSEDLYDLEF